MGIALLAGRDFSEHDAPGPGSAVIINRTMARHYFGDETPLGKRRRFVEGNRPPMEIIGVAADSKYNNLREQASDCFYVPSTRGEDRYLKFLVLRGQRNASGLAGPVRQLVRSFNSSISILHTETLREQVDESLHQDRFIAALCGVFSSLALVLTCVGLFGLLSFSVARRTSEIGVRMALGARRERNAVCGGWTVHWRGRSRYGHCAPEGDALSRQTWRPHCPWCCRNFADMCCTAGLLSTGQERGADRLNTGAEK